MASDGQEVVQAQAWVQETPVEKAASEGEQSRRKRGGVGKRPDDQAAHTESQASHGGATTFVMDARRDVAAAGQSWRNRGVRAGHEGGRD